MVARGGKRDADDTLCVTEILERADARGRRARRSCQTVVLGGKRKKETKRKVCSVLIEKTLMGGKGALSKGAVNTTWEEEG